MNRCVELVEDHLLVWILVAVAVGVLFPQVAAVTRLSTLILAVMIGSISLTLTVERFRAVRRRPLALVLAGHVLMPFIAFGIARLVGFSPALTVGFVVLGAVTPELVTPVMTELADGDTALATTALVVIGLGSIAFLPVVVTTLVGREVTVAPLVIVEQLAVSVVVPMLAAVGARAIRPSVVSRGDDYYPAISSLMVILIIGGVTAANADTIRDGGGRLLSVVLAGVALNAVGYAIGWLGSVRESRAERIASTLSVGMRDFAVAAALVIGAGLPPLASLPAVSFGVVEMVTSAGLARYFGTSGER